MATRESLWIYLLGAGSLLAFGSIWIGIEAQYASCLIVIFASCAAINVGVKLWKPVAKGPWRLLTTGIALILFSYVLEFSGIGNSNLPKWSDVVGLVSYGCVIACFYRFGQLRSNRHDPTNLIDAFVFTLATGVLLWGLFVLDFMHDPYLALEEKRITAIYAVLDSCIFFVTSRLAFGKGVNSLSYYFIAAGAFLILVSDVVIAAELGSSSIWGEEQLSILFPTLAVLAGGVAALHPSMGHIATHAVVDLGRMGKSRLLATTLAVVVPPIVVIEKYRITEDWSYVQLLGPVCLAIVVLVMARVGGLADARERNARVQIAEAALNERYRIERDIHDGSQQRLLAAMARLGTMKKQPLDDRAIATVDLIVSDLKSTLASIRNLTHGECPAELRQFGLKTAVEEIANDLPLEVDLDIDQRRYIDSVELAAYFVISEGLANVVKHSDASKVKVEASFQNGALTIEVSDNGSGGVIDRKGSGLKGLEERISSLGGVFSVESSPGAGPLLKASLPC